MLAAILEKVHKRETMVLEYWALRKKQQDRCMQFLQYESSAKQVIVFPCYQTLIDTTC